MLFETKILQNLVIFTYYFRKTISFHQGDDILLEDAVVFSEPLRVGMT